VVGGENQRIVLRDENLIFDFDCGLKMVSARLYVFAFFPVLKAQDLFTFLFQVACRKSRKQK